MNMRDLNVDNINTLDEENAADFPLVVYKPQPWASSAPQFNRNNNSVITHFQTQNQLKHEIYADVNNVP